MATPTLENDIFEQLSTEETTAQFILTPINQIQVYDTNGNLQETINSVTVTYSNGKLEVKGEFTSTESYTIGYIAIGSYYGGVFKQYFVDKSLNGQSVKSSNLYEITSTVTLNTIKLLLSPFTSATVNVSKLVNIIGSILAGNPVETGKSGALFSGIYIINTTSNVAQSYRIPVSIITIQNGVLLIGGIASNTVSGNQIVLRDSAETTLISVTGISPITIKAGRQVIFELSF